MSDSKMIYAHTNFNDDTIYSEGELIEEKAKVDMVNKPPHYRQHPSGIECIEITEHMNFCLGNAIKYIWRADLKSDDPVQDLEKAVVYLKREIARIQKGQK